MGLPRSLLVRIFLWVTVLVLVTNGAWIMVFRLADAEPRAKALAQFAASAVNLVRVSLLTADPGLRPGLLQELSDQEGIRLLPKDPKDNIAPLPQQSFMTITESRLRHLLGPKTVLALRVNGEDGLWVSFTMTPDDQDEFWLILPLNRIEHHTPWHWLGWGGLAAILALAVAWWIASHISRSMRRIAKAAHQVGLGKTPPPLTEEGPDEIVNLTRAFNRMSRDLAYHEQERAEILAGISHDLRTPLARMRLEAELSLPEGPALEGMTADIVQMDNIIAQFLDYARSEGEEPSVPTDIAALLENLAEYGQAIQRPVSLKLSPLPIVSVKPRALGRALGNLVDNAWKYGAPPVTLGAEIKQGWLELSVLDHGPGVPADQRERLKRPFTRIESARSGAGGTGLGLAIAERVSRAHGGSLRLDEGPGGQGLLVVLRLPLS